MDSSGNLKYCLVCSCPLVAYSHCISGFIGFVWDLFWLVALQTSEGSKLCHKKSVIKCSIAFSAPFIFQLLSFSSVRFVRLLCFVCFFKRLFIQHSRQFNRLFNSGIDIGKLVKCINIVQFYEALSSYQMWKTRVVLVFEKNSWKIKKHYLCSNLPLSDRYTNLIGLFEKSNVMLFASCFSLDFTLK